MRKRNLRKAIAGIMALMMVALGAGILSGGSISYENRVSAAVTEQAEQDELAELQEELKADLELIGEGLGDSSDELKKVVSDGISAVDNSESLDELEDVWESVKAQIDSLINC